MSLRSPALPRLELPQRRGHPRLHKVDKGAHAGRQVLASFGGQPIARGERFEALEGSAAGRPYLVKFPSYAAARACFYSAAYQEAIALRAETASFDIVVVEGMPA